MLLVQIETNKRSVNNIDLRWVDLGVETNVRFIDFHQYSVLCQESQNYMHINSEEQGTF